MEHLEKSWNIKKKNIFKLGKVLEIPNVLEKCMEICYIPMFIYTVLLKE